MIDSNHAMVVLVLGLEQSQQRLQPLAASQTPTELTTAALECLQALELVTAITMLLDRSVG